MDSYIRPVPLEKANRLINHGPTVLVSASHGGVDNVMAAAWVCGLDFAPPKVTLVLGRTSKTRELAEKSGHLVVQVPTVRQAQLVHAVGNSSGRDDAEKLKRCGVELFRLDGVPAPLVAGIARSVMKSRRIDRSRRDGVHPDAVRLQCNRGGTRH